MRGFIICIHDHVCHEDDKINKNEISWSCGTYERERQCIQGFGEAT